MQLTKLDNVKGWLNIELADTSANETLTRLIASASDWLEQQMRRTFDADEQAERFSGDGSRGYSPKRVPLISVKSVVIDSDTLVADQDYILVDDRVELINGWFFARGRYNCVVTYTAGYLAAPPAVEQACVLLVGEAFRGRDRIGLMNRTLGSGETVNFRPDQIPVSVQSTIDLFLAAVVP